MEKRNAPLIVRPLFLALALASAPGLSSALRAEEPAAAPAPAAPAAPAETASTESVYVYKAEKARDPFVSLTGTGASIVRVVAGDEGPFKADGMELTGLLMTRTGRWAVLKGPSGEAYMVQNGKILDGKRKPVQGFVGIVKEKSLVIIGPNNQVTELKLKRDKEKEKKP